MNKKINFYPTNKNIEKSSYPIPAKKSIPQWYKDITLYNSSNNPVNSEVVNYGSGVDGSALSVKVCTPFYDAMTIGYHYVLPEDVEVILNHNGIPSFSWKSNDWIINRVPDVEIPIPPYHHPICFTFRIMFGIDLPKGSSAILTQPMNRNDLPFTIPSGIVDADIKFFPLDIRFFLKRGVEGIIKKGTPIIQVIPFTRESWQMEVDDSILEEKMWLHEKRRTMLSSWYTKNAHSKKEYN